MISSALKFVVFDCGFLGQFLYIEFELTNKSAPEWTRTDLQWNAWTEGVGTVNSPFRKGGPELLCVLSVNVGGRQNEFGMEPDW